MPHVRICAGGGEQSSSLPRPMEVLQGKTTVAEASRSYDLPPSEIESWVDEAKRGMENALRVNPLDIRERARIREVLLRPRFR